MKQIIIRMPDEGNPKFIALLDEMRRLPQIQIKEQAIDLQDFGVQIDTLRSLTDGWMNGQGMAPDAKGLDWLSRAFEKHWPLSTPPPWLCLTEEGNVDAEWRLENKDANLEIDLKAHTAEWLLLDLKTEAFEERSLDLNQAADWCWLAEAIAKQTQEVR